MPNDLPHTQDNNLTDHSQNDTGQDTVTIHHSPSPSASPSFISQGHGPNSSDTDADEFDLLDTELLRSDDFLDPENEWETHYDPASDGPFYVHKQLLAKGIAAFSDQIDPNITDMKFPHGTRHFKFSTFGERIKKYKKQASSSGQIFSQLRMFSQNSALGKQLDEAYPQFVAPIKTIIAEYAYDTTLSLSKDLNVIATENRSDEIYFPFHFRDQLNAADTGLYVYPWTSVENPGKNEEMAFTGVIDFFSGSCLFGAALEGGDEKDDWLQLIKADLRLYPGQKITAINYNKALQFHSTVQLQELENQISLASSLANEDKSKNVQFHYHLPGYDYLLQGVELLIKNHMTLPAFESFCYIVLKHQAFYAYKVTKIGQKYNFPINIVNPFAFIFDQLHKINFYENSQQETAAKTAVMKAKDNLKKAKEALKSAGTPEEESAAANSIASAKAKQDATIKDLQSFITRQENEKKTLAAALLAILKINPPEEDATITNFETVIQERTVNELNAVHHCILLLKAKNNENHSPALAKAWNDFIDHQDKPIRSLKTLAHLGNTVMVAAVAQDKERHTVCAMFPVSEKHIFIEYRNFIKKQADNKKQANYSDIICLMVMPPVHPYTKKLKKNVGQAFYYARKAEFLVDPTKEVNLLDRARKNVAMMALSIFAQPTGEETKTSPTSAKSSLRK